MIDVRIRPQKNVIDDGFLDGEISINTGSSYILTDLEDIERVKALIESYNLEFNPNQDLKLLELMNY